MGFALLTHPIRFAAEAVVWPCASPLPLPNPPPHAGEGRVGAGGAREHKGFRSLELSRPVHAVVDEFVNDARIGQGRDVTESVVLVRGDLAQNSTHDLAGPGFWQSRGPL